MIMVSPMKALIFVIVFIVLQQIEGNLIYPKVVGGSARLAVTLGFGGCYNRQQSYGRGRYAVLYTVYIGDIYARARMDI